MAICFPEEIKGYFGDRGLLFNLHSDFSCPDPCKRPGCKEGNLRVGVNIVDLLGISFATGKKLSELYKTYFRIGVAQEKGRPFVKRIGLELRKPCGFLEGRICGVYPVRPIVCALFPESVYASKSLQEEYIGKRRFKHYLCLTRSESLSRERRDCIAKLRDIHKRESLLSDLYLFGCSPFLIDFKNRMEELIMLSKRLRKHKGMGIEEYYQSFREYLDFDGESEEEQLVEEMRRGRRYLITHEVFNMFLNEELKEIGYAQDIVSKIERLDDYENLKGLFKMKEMTDYIADGLDLSSRANVYEFDGADLRLKPL